ncbi:MAG: DUF485 domain-containing protein [Bacteroidales bacterium]|nr:DUF485 domain-containing protein [Bacteroidales bacterium]
MDHGPAVVLDEDQASERKARLGVWMFILYSIVYAGFVAIGVINYELMGKIVLGNQNLAIVYGIFLILFAIFLGLIYNWRCTKLENKLNKEVQS